MVKRLAIKNWRNGFFLNKFSHLQNCFFSYHDKMKYKLFLFVGLFVSCASSKSGQTVVLDKNIFPTFREQVSRLPSKENFHIFILAGQSNMAGRGFVQPEDTVANHRILTMNKDNQWEYAKEPLHYYEPERAGLDCGMSFAQKMVAKSGKNVVIGLLPCAIGGSSIGQWLNDSTYRGVTLYSNLLKRIHEAQQYGIIKGMLWHQGESNANEKGFKNFKTNAIQFFNNLRTDTDMANLPIYAGTIGSFLRKQEFPLASNINATLNELPTYLNQFYLVTTNGLEPKSDTIHFNTESQRLLGERYAKMVLRPKK